MATRQNLPAFFNCPQYIIDEVAYALTREEFLVLMFAVRHILGWHDKFASRQAHISLSVFSKGRPTKTGTIMKGTGLGEPALRKALNSLVKYGLIHRVEDPSDKGHLKGQLWELPIDYDPDQLAERINEREAFNKKRTEKARANQPKKPKKAKRGDVAHQTYIDTLHTQSIDILAPSGASPLSSSSKAPASDDMWHSPISQGAAAPHVGTSLYACRGEDIVALISAWLNWSPARPTRRGKFMSNSEHYANKTNREYAQVLWERGYRPNDFIAWWHEQRAAALKTGKAIETMSFVFAAERVERWTPQHRGQTIYTRDCPRCYAWTPDARNGNEEAEALALWMEGLDEAAESLGYSIDLPPRLFTAAEYELLKTGKPLPEDLEFEEAI